MEGGPGTSSHMMWQFIASRWSSFYVSASSSYVEVTGSLLDPVKHHSSSTMQQSHFRQPGIPAKVENGNPPPSKMVLGLSPYYITFYNFQRRSWLLGVALRYVELFYHFTGSQTCVTVGLGVILHVKRCPPPRHLMLITHTCQPYRIFRETPGKL